MFLFKKITKFNNLLYLRNIDMVNHNFYNIWFGKNSHRNRNKISIWNVYKIYFFIKINRYCSLTKDSLYLQLFTFLKEIFWLSTYLNIYNIQKYLTHIDNINCHKSAWHFCTSKSGCIREVLPSFAFKLNFFFFVLYMYESIFVVFIYHPGPKNNTVISYCTQILFIIITCTIMYKE